MRLSPLAPLLALAALVGPAIAQPGGAGSFEEDLGKLLAQPGGLTADQAATRAAKASTDVAKTQAQLDEARTGLDTITRAFVPRTSVGASYTRLSPVSLAFGPGMPFDLPVNTYHLGADAAIPLTDLLLRLPPEKRSIEHGVRAAETNHENAKLSAAVDARVAYYEWVRAELSVVVARRLLAQVTANLGQIQALAAVDRVSRADVLRLEAQQAQAELGLTQVTELSALRAELLRIAIGAAPDEPLAIGEDVRDIGPDAQVASAAELTRTAVERRLEFDALASARASLEAHRKAAGVDRLPKLNLFGQAAYDKPSQRNFLSNDFELAWAAGVQLTWNLNEFLNAKPNDDRFAAQLRALDADRASLELGVRAQVTAARQAVVIADRSYASTQRALAAAEESYRVRQALLAAERATAIELIDAETELTRARIAAIDALINRRIARAQLAHAIGEDTK